MSKSLLLILLITFISSNNSQCYAKNNSEILQEINNQLGNATNDTDKIRYYDARSMYYYNNNNYQKSIDDLTSILKIEDSGWARLRRAKAYYKMQQFDLAKGDASLAKKENISLAADADLLIYNSENKLKTANPVSIVLDRDTDPNRRSRMDVMKEQEAMEQVGLGQGPGSKSHSAGSRMTSEEKEALRLKYEALSRKCFERKGSEAECTTKALNNYKSSLAQLEENPDQYFQSKMDRAGSRKATSRQEDPVKSGMNVPSNAVINGEWDSQGRHYTPAGGGNAWRNDGTFMQKAAGGYIDTKTGQFVPAN